MSIGQYFRNDQRLQTDPPYGFYDFEMRALNVAGILGDTRRHSDRMAAIGTLMQHGVSYEHAKVVTFGIEWGRKVDQGYLDWLLGGKSTPVVPLVCPACLRTTVASQRSFATCTCRRVPVEMVRYDPRARIPWGFLAPTLKTVAIFPFTWE